MSKSESEELNPLLHSPKLHVQTVTLDSDRPGYMKYGLIYITKIVLIPTLGERRILKPRLDGSQPPTLPLSYVHHSVPRNYTPAQKYTVQSHCTNRNDFSRNYVPHRGNDPLFRR